MYHHEIFTEAKYSQKIGRVRKSLHFSELRRAGDFSDVLVTAAIIILYPLKRE